MHLHAAHVAIANGLGQLIQCEIPCAPAGIEAVHAEIDCIRTIADGSPQCVKRAGRR